MAVDLEPLDQALETAHLPALSAALVHLTGDAGWLRPEWRPMYTPLSRGETGVSEDEQAKMRAAAGAQVRGQAVERAGDRGRHVGPADGDPPDPGRGSVRDRRQERGRGRD